MAIQTIESTDTLNQGREKINSNFAEVKPYKVYTALLTQSGTDDPVATVVENTIGDIVWTRDSIGIYLANLSNAFTVNKTIINCWLNFRTTAASFANCSISNENVCSFLTYSGFSPFLTANLIDIDGDGLFVEIRVYP